MYDLICPQCGERGKSQDYPGEHLYCWNCRREERGRVEVVRVSTSEEVEAVLKQLPGREITKRKSA